MLTRLRFSLYDALEMIVALGVQQVEPGFFLGLDKARPQLKTNEDLSPEDRKELKSRAIAARWPSNTSTIRRS